MAGSVKDCEMFSFGFKESSSHFNSFSFVSFCEKNRLIDNFLHIKGHFTLNKIGTHKYNILSSYLPGWYPCTTTDTRFHDFFLSLPFHIFLMFFYQPFPLNTSFGLRLLISRHLHKIKIILCSALLKNYRLR